MNEIVKPNESFINPESRNAVYKSTLLLNHESASDFITEKVLNFPIKRIIVFGEPGANKTTIMLQLASELMRKSPDIEPDFIFYDDALAKAKKDLGVNILSKNQYPLVSNILTNQIKERFPTDQTPDKRIIQFVELVGISLNDRGTSTLREAAKRVSNQKMLEQDTLVIGVSADSRSLKYAGNMRRSISELDDHTKVFDVLKDFNTQVSDIPRNKPIDQVTKDIVDFFGRMATEERIKIVHNEVMTQATRRAMEDNNRLFRMLRVPDLPFPIEDRETLKKYLLGAAFLQTYLTELGLKNEPYDLEPSLLRDSGIVIFSPYNPNITKVIDLSRALK
jgi:adenylate kinase family enzyme